MKEYKFIKEFLEKYKFIKKLLYPLRKTRQEWKFRESARIMFKRKKPKIDDGDIKIFNKELLGIGKKLDVLEWGSGYSTKYFPELLKNNKIEFTWDSIEHNKMWFKLISKLGLPTEVKMYLAKREEYVNFPHKKYDLIFVDGIGELRNECLEKARHLLKPNGFVLLHDHNKPENEEGRKLYKGQFLSKQLWKGYKKESR